MFTGDQETAIRLAKELYERKRQEGIDFSEGPCLAEELMPDWCADIVHVPRDPIDNRVEYQCSTYRSGKVHHFVELDPDGNVVRAI